LAISETLPASLGLTKAYTSVLSTDGSDNMYGASRWLDAEEVEGPSSAAPDAAVAVAATGRGRVGAPPASWIWTWISWTSEEAV
jgi:hypothetical protein